MKIDAQNIEEVIFDFHEGNLSDTEKAGLMDFLHKHPEYEREFALWAKSYHYADEPLSEYGHNDRFLKPTHLPVSYKWMGLAASTSILFFTWLWWPKGVVKEKALMKWETVPKTVSPASSSVERQPFETEKKKKKQSTVLVSNIAPTIQEIPLEQLVLDSALQESHDPVLVQEKDTVLTTQKIPIVEHEEKQVPASSSPPKVKRKRKLDLTPTDHILPFNSDF